MASHPVDIKASLSDLVEASAKQGPQAVRKDGVDAAVLISIEDWKYLKAHHPGPLPSEGPRPNLKDILLDPNGPHDLYIPPRRPILRRSPVEFE